MGLFCRGSTAWFRTSPKPALAPPSNGPQPYPPKPGARKTLTAEGDKPKKQETRPIKLQQDRSERLAVVCTATPLSDLHPCERPHPTSAHPPAPPKASQKNFLCFPWVKQGTPPPVLPG
ncbi:hypothetical protein I3842_14G127900 [Carya illinoinensis]|uniref:Uncharacterized protein n=1 Tax=Carya illinoinensis TaxID=32201 RepID=A0A922DD85_CARIL|nr:hypothetical protein I3842_14G127900 [Carya illinoinensis]